MKVLFSHSLPFFLAHGGSQTLIEALMRELACLGVQVEPVRWWDDRQSGDILHYVGRPPSTAHVSLAHEKRFKVVMTELLDQTASRSKSRLSMQRFAIRTIRRTFPRVTGRFSWGLYQEMDGMVYALEHEWKVAQYLFDANPARGYIIPHGLENDALKQLSAPAPEGDYLVSIATIHPRKNTVLLAQAARQARVPILFLGKPYSQDNDYFLRFKELVDGQYVRYPGFVPETEKYRYLCGARGFALLSQFESGCIAVYEAAAARLPLFLSNLPWAAKGYPRATALTLANLRGPAEVAAQLGPFYQQARRRSEPTFPVPSWREVAQEYLRLYEKILAAPFKA